MTFHISDNELQPKPESSNYDRLYKVIVCLSSLQENFKKYAGPGARMCVDKFESAVSGTEPCGRLFVYIFMVNFVSLYSTYSCYPVWYYVSLSFWCLRVCEWRCHRVAYRMSCLCLWWIDTLSMIGWSCSASKYIFYRDSSCYQQHQLDDYKYFIPHQMFGSYVLVILFLQEKGGLCQNPRCYTWQLLT